MSHAPAAIASEQFRRPAARIARRRESRTDPRQFGRARPRTLAAVAERRSSWSIGDDLWLFCSTFLAGFLFVSIFIA